MSTILRISGTNLNVTELVKSSSLEFFGSWHRGEPQLNSAPKLGLNQTSGTNVLVNEAGFDQFEKVLRK